MLHPIGEPEASAPGGPSAAVAPRHSPTSPYILHFFLFVAVPVHPGGVVHFGARPLQQLPLGLSFVGDRKIPAMTIRVVTTEDFLVGVPVEFHATKFN